VGGGFAAAEGTPPLPALTLRLEPLSEEDARALVRAAAGSRRLSDQQLEAMIERAAGNPLFLEELASSEETSKAEELPETVQALVATRIDKLSPGDRALLRWASVLGISFSGALIIDVLEGDESVAAASEAWGRLEEFVEMDPEVAGAFRFRHALTRDAAYEGLSFKRRRFLHGRVAEVIERREGEDAVELLSLHCHHAERWPETWRYSVLAAERAWEKHANADAAQFFARALEIRKRVPDLPSEEVARVWEALGDARTRAGAYEHAGEAFRAARKASPRDLVEQARLMKKDAVALLRMGRYTQALRRLSQALRRLEGLDSQPAIAERARLLGSYALVLSSQRRPAATIRWCEAAITEAETSRALDALAQAYSTLDRAYIALGRLGEAVYSARAVTILEELGDLDQLAWALNNLGAKAYLEGRWNDALDHITRARDVWTKVGDDTSASMADFNGAEMLSNQGRWDEAEPLLERVLHMQQQAQNLLHVALATKSLGRLAARKGRFDEASSLLEDARTLFESGHDVVELLTTDAHIVELHVLRGDPAGALALAADVLAHAETMDGVTVQLAMLHRLRGWALIQSGELDAAPTALAEALRIVRGEVGNHGIESADYDTALTLDALAHLGRLTGEPVEEFERERDEILDRLGVVGIFEPPLVQS
jgi:tetratricopeptide (TPR) repeat protein